MGKEEKEEKKEEKVIRAGKLDTLTERLCALLYSRLGKRPI